jgi:hypothetical protein
LNIAYRRDLSTQGAKTQRLSLQSPSKPPPENKTIEHIIGYTFMSDVVSFFDTTGFFLLYVLAPLRALKIKKPPPYGWRLYTYIIDSKKMAFIK